MIRKANVHIRGFEVSYANPALHKFTADVELQAGYHASAQVYSFKFVGILAAQERADLENLIARIVERVKYEFKDSLS